VLRIIEVCFLLNDGPTPPGVIRVFQHLPPYLLVLGGWVVVMLNEMLNDWAVAHSA
jgi:hypothetical protein